MKPTNATALLPSGADGGAGVELGSGGKSSKKMVSADGLLVG
jgi:hypothetical protein